MGRLCRTVLLAVKSILWSVVNAFLSNCAVGDVVRTGKRNPIICSPILRGQQIGFGLYLVWRLTDQQVSSSVQLLCYEIEGQV